MPNVLIPLASGCEELEAVTLVDLLRRASFEVVVAGLTAGPVVASRGTVLVPDTTLDAVLADTFDLIALPGGLPGAEHLAADERLLGLLRDQAASGGWVAAICAAPRVLVRAGLLEGRRATCYPGSLLARDLPGTTLVSDPVAVDGRIVTGRGPGSAIDFALTLIECLAGGEARAEVESALLRGPQAL